MAQSKVIIVPKGLLTWVLIGILKVYCKVRKFICYKQGKEYVFYLYQTK